MMAFASLVNQSLLRADPGTSGGIWRHEARLSPARETSHLSLHERRLLEIDSFDPKPALAKYDGQPMPGGSVKTERRTGELMKSPFSTRSTASAAWSSANCGRILARWRTTSAGYAPFTPKFPTMSRLLDGEHGRQSSRQALHGSVVTYGLGTENQNLPGYMVLCPDIPTTVGPPLWSNGFLPAMYQGTYISNSDGQEEGAQMGHGRQTCRRIRMARKNTRKS